jgi:hypothetical protein
MSYIEWWAELSRDQNKFIKEKGVYDPNTDIAYLTHQLKNMLGRPLDLYQLLEKFRDTLFKVTIGKPSETEARKVVLRNLLKQNPIGIKRESLEQ